MSEYIRKETRKYAVLGWMVGVMGVNTTEAADIVELIDPALSDEEFVKEACRSNPEWRGFLAGYQAAGGKVFED